MWLPHCDINTTIHDYNTIDKVQIYKKRFDGNCNLLNWIVIMDCRRHHSYRSVVQRPYICIMHYAMYMYALCMNLTQEKWSTASLLHGIGTNYCTLVGIDMADLGDCCHLQGVKFYSRAAAVVVFVFGFVVACICVWLYLYLCLVAFLFVFGCVCICVWLCVGYYMAVTY